MSSHVIIFDVNVFTNHHCLQCLHTFLGVISGRKTESMRDHHLCYPAILTNTLVPQPGLSSILQNQLRVALDALTEDEDPRDLYWRVTTLAVALQDRGSKDTDDTWIKSKFLKAIMPFNKGMSSVIRQRPDFHTLSSSDVLDEFIAMNIMNKTADNALARAQRSKKASPNLALKAKAIPEEEEEEEEEEECCTEKA